MTFMNILAGLGFGIGLFFILCDIFKVPTYKTSSALMGLEKQFNTKESRINSSLEEIAVWLSKHIRLSEYKKAQMEGDLITARLDITPEMYVANCIIKAAVVALLAIPVLPLFPYFSMLILIFSVVYYFILLRQLRGKIQEHRAAVEYELPRLIFTIERVLQHNRNVLIMLENYKEIAGPDMKQELEVTIADMNSGNMETAISRLEIRVGSTMMSDVCRGLLSVMRGDDTIAYWRTLEEKFTQHQREILRAKANKIPAKVNRLSMTILFCFMAMWMGVLLIQAFESLSIMFEGL